MITKLFSCVVLFSVALAVPAVPSNSHEDNRTRIIDGDPQQKINFYEVAIVSDNDGTPVKVCSGVLINVRWVLTSAFCANRRTNLRVQYGSGQVDLSGYTGDLVYRKHVHPYFNPTYMINDIALLELNPIATGAITQVGLPPNLIENYVGKTGVVSGFGAVGSFQEYSWILMSKQVTVINNAYCQQDGNYMTPYKLCTEGRAICDGDQGGPLVVGSTVIGITSAALNAQACEGMLSTSFTRVNYYLGWIQQITRINCT